MIRRTFAVAAVLMLAFAGCDRECEPENHECPHGVTPPIAVPERANPPKSEAAKPGAPPEQIEPEIKLDFGDEAVLARKYFKVLHSEIKADAKARENEKALKLPDKLPGLFDPPADGDAEREREKKQKREKIAAKYIEQLRTSTDEDERASAAEILGTLGATAAIPELVECLNPARKEKDSVMRMANGALTKIARQNFGINGYKEWHHWMLLEKYGGAPAKAGASEADKLAAAIANEKGMEALRKDKGAEAYSQFAAAIKSNPAIPNYHNNAGLALLVNGKPLEAIEFFQQMIALDPNLPQPYMNIARCYVKLNRKDDADLWFQKAKIRDTEGVLPKK